MKRYMTQENQKNGNLSAILSYIMEHGASSRREIQEETGFSWGTVSEAAAQLIARGYLTEEKDTRRGGAGRTGPVLKLSGGEVALIGVDLNLSGLTAEILGFDRTVKHTVRRPFPGGDQRTVLDAVLSLCDEAAAYCAGKYRVFAICIAVQGAVDSAAGVSVRFPLAGGWIPCSLGQMLTERYGVFAFVDHDPKCMLRAKAHELQAESAEPMDLMLIRVDQGIGMSVMQGGRIAEDRDKMELGHTLSVYGGLPCKCGRRGCLEAYSSLSGIAARCGVSYGEVMREPEKYADILTDALRYLAIAVHNAAMLFYPHRIIFTGDAIAGDDGFLPRFSEIFDELEKAEGRRPIELSADSGISAAAGAAMGAAAQAVKQLYI